MPLPQPPEKSPVPKGVWLALCVACVSGFEGLRTVAYRDPVGIPTICFGETAKVSLGDTATADQCKDMLGARLLEFGRQVDKCTPHTVLPPYRKAAVTSFAYNVGVKAYCSSTLARKLDAGDVKGGCNEFSKWVYATNRSGVRIELPGLVSRRAEERTMCLREAA